MQQVVDIVEGGSASETGLLKKRDKLNDISGADVRWPLAAQFGVAYERSLCGENTHRYDTVSVTTGGAPA